MWRRLLVCTRVDLCGALRVISGGNQVDGLPPAPSNATRVKGPGLRPNIYMARGVFARVVLMIQPSDRRGAKHSTLCLECWREAPGTRRAKMVILGF